jgi:hypothetical protein
VIGSDSVIRRLEWIGSRLEAAVAARITFLVADDAAPGDHSYASELAWEAIQDGDLSPFAERVADAAVRLGLDEASLDVLWLCAAPELDARFARVYSFLLDDAMRQFPTPRLVSLLLAVDSTTPGQILARLGADGLLRQRGCVHLIETERAVPLLDHPIRLAPTLAGFLLQTQLQDGAVDPRLQRRDPPSHPMGRKATVARIRAALNASGEPALVLGGADAADLLAQAAQRGLVVIDARAAADIELVSRAELMAALEDRVLVFGITCALSPDEASALRARIESGARRGLACASTLGMASRLGSLGALAIEVPMPSPPERRAAWSELTGVEATGGVAAKFRLSIAQIALAARIARAEAEVAGRGTPDASDLDAGARQASGAALGDRAVRLVPDRHWEELVLPERQLEQLRSISAYLLHRDQVLSDWGFDRAVSGAHGLSVLFAGESGTGKTMAARVLAADLGLELFSINLATVVSKFVGETEQNLERIFVAAEGSNAILLFDEADALFGRRSEVSDASDRYANIEVAYLLQRIEAHTGAVILTTNLKQNIDAGFLRRVDFVLDFHFPDENDRRRLWATVIPAKAPVAADIDFDFLAERFKLSGGSIRNCSLAAAFEAASAGQPVRMAHIVRAVGSEYRKLGRLTVESDFGAYFGMLRNPDAMAEPERVVEPATEPPAPEAEAPRPGRVSVAARIEEL